jgi:hypothetical protein
LAGDDADALIKYMAEQSRAAHGDAGTAPAAPAAPARPAAASMAAISDPYLRIQQALNGDTVADIKAAAQAIAAEAAALGAPGAAIRAAALLFEGVGGIVPARAAFAALSDALIDYAKTTGVALGDGMKVAYCPMARKSWLQKGDTIRNPYYGKAMSDCGRFVADAPATNR